MSTYGAGGGPECLYDPDDDWDEDEDDFDEDEEDDDWDDDENGGEG